jgi:hypothetical protein
MLTSELCPVAHRHIHLILPVKPSDALHKRQGDEVKSKPQHAFAGAHKTAQQGLPHNIISRLFVRYSAQVESERGLRDGDSVGRRLNTSMDWI